MSQRKRKHDRREMTISSDETSMKMVYSKDKSSYSSTSSHKKKSSKHKKNKKSNKYHSDVSSNSESESDYDSKKENKKAMKYKKKHSKEKFENYEEKLSKKYEEKLSKKYEEKLSKKYEKNKYHDEKQDSSRSDKMYNDDIFPEKDLYDTKKSRKRSRSQERQRYGKWSETTDKNKKVHSSNRADFDDREGYEIQNKRQRTSDKYNRKEKHRHDSDIENCDDYESYKERRRSSRREMSYERNDAQKNKYKDNKYYNEENYESSSRVDSDQERRSYSSSKAKRPREYIDLDDPNRQDYENTENETDLNDKTKDKKTNSKKSDDIEPLSKKEKIININTRTGGAYIPPARLRMMQESIQDKSSEAYQRLAWEALKKTIIGMTNKVNGSNISDLIIELFKENIIRGRGVLARAIMQAQGASPTFTRVYAALVAVINSKFPEIGELILKRLIIQYKRGFRRNDKTVCLTAARFLAHLLNQEVAHEVLILEIVTHLLENPTDDSVEVAICILKECGKKLTQLTARGMRAITERVREVLHEGNVNSRTRYMIEVFFAVQKDGFKEFEIITEELDLIEDEDKFTHLITLDEGVDAQEMLNIFKFDPEYQENEEKYKAVVKEILGDSDEEESGPESDSEGEEEDEEEKKEESQQIVDMTETNIVCLRRKIYLTIQSSLDFEECAHKLLKLELKPGQILEMCYMILDCCAQQRTYEKFYGLLAQRFCRLNKIYVEPFTEIFQNSYKTIHRLETNKLRNVAKFFAHLLFTDAISWTVLSIIKLNEDDTSSSSRIFIKILFQELCEYLGLAKLNERVKDVTLQEAFEGLFPRDLPHNTRFAINFFTSIGLGGLTDELREHLKNMQKTPVIQVSPNKASSSSSTSSSASSSSSSSDSD